MSAALYYPFSRCLDEAALKRAVLLFDELLFVDPVDPLTRTALYANEGPLAGQDVSLSNAWLAAESNYNLLAGQGIVRTVDSKLLRNPSAADALVRGGLELDVEINRSSTTLFRGQRRWQMLESRLPPSALAKRYRPRPGPKNWTGERVVDVRYAVGASVALSYALIIAHELGVTPFTDQPAHDMLLRQRLMSAAAGDVLQGVHGAAHQPYLRSRVERHLVETLVSDEQLKSVSMQEIVNYRQANEPARRELASLISQFTSQAQRRPWDGALDDDLNSIAEKASLIAEELPGPRNVWRSFTDSMTKPSVRLKVAERASVTAFVAPHFPLLAALAAGAWALVGTAHDIALAACDDLDRARSPEQNAVAYLHQLSRW